MAARFNFVISSFSNKKKKNKKKAAKELSKIKSGKHSHMMDVDDEDEETYALDEEPFNIEITRLSKSVCLFLLFLFLLLF